MIVIMVGVVSGGGVYFWQQTLMSELDSELQTTKLELEELQERIKDLEEQLASAISPEELEELKVIDRNFDRPHERLTYPSYDDLEVGDKVGGLEVADLFSHGGNDVAGVIGVEFDGIIEITGVLNRVDSDVFPPFHIGHILFSPDIDSQNKLPRYENASDRDWQSSVFHSPDAEEIIEMVGLEKGQSIAATIQVENVKYPHLSGFDGELGSFELVEIVELYPNWLQITEAGVEFKSTDEPSRD